MRLPFSFSFKKKELPEYIVSFIIKDTSISAVIFETENNMISVFSHTKKILDNPISKISYETLLDICDKTVSSAEQKLPEGAVLKKTIFSLPQDWVIEGKIKKEFVGELKKICEELSLEPIGFLVLTEAILHALQKQEGAPVSAIVVELGSATCSVSLSRAGRIVEHMNMVLEDSIPRTVESALKQFAHAEILPARIIIFDESHKENLSHIFLRHAWSKSLPFLHVPQVTVLPKAFDIHAVLLGTATQMEFTVKNENFLKEKEVEEVLPVAEDEAIEVEKEKKEQESAEIEEEKEEKTEEIKENKVESAFAKPDKEADTFGFAVNRDVADTAESHIEKKLEELPEIIKEEITHENQRDSLPTESKLLFEGVAQGVKKIFASFQKKKKANVVKLPQTVEQESIPIESEGKSNSKRIIFAISGLLALIILIIGYIYIVHASVVIGVTPQTVEDSQSIILASNASTDINTKTLGIKSVQSAQNGSVSADATGSKDIGTPAKGQITIFSRLSDSSSFPKGTTIVASNGLKFSLDSDTNIASFSGGPDDPSVTVSNVSVTANDIGPEYNFPSGTKFTLSGQSKSDVSAKNDNAFGGGTKSTVTVVSQKDIDGLATTLIKNLEQNAKADIGKNVGGDTALIDGFTKEEVSQKKLDKQVGDKAKKVSLTATVTYEALTYNKQDVSSFGNKIINSKLPSGMALSADGVTANISDIKKKDDNSSQATLSVKAAFVPKLDILSLQKQIAGKKFTEVTNIIKNFPQVSNVQIVISPSIPFLPAVLPRIPSHINISLKVNG